MAANWDEKTVFLTALELPKEERAAYLSSACPDEASRTRIESLLEHHEVVTRELLSALPPGETGESKDIPTRIDEFQIVRELGRGGMGVIYLARDLILEREAALKVLGGDLADSESAL